MLARPAIAVFRPDDERLERAIDVLTVLGAEPVADPMLAIEPTGTLPRSDANVVVFTSSTAADIIAGQWTPGDTMVCAIGPRTATALEDREIPVDVIPETYDSAGLVERLADVVDGYRVEIARSDHGSEVLPSGLQTAGAYVHETTLYCIKRPPHAGTSVDRAIEGSLDGLVFTSPLMVEHFLETVNERDGPAADALVADPVVGAIGDPTATALRRGGIEPDVIAPKADFKVLAKAVLDVIQA